ncbi:unnamed protein product [Parascedosporium putredinis]|uniref:Glycosyltransferase family 25 protein n=1 Tax=Parascedosporium putredinis TaxID=1442378 RepID=A0A9P1GZH3_9PEZI|nr:unnamed protein product [Parascedosporium putredinis]CAI7990811.1 unnamed protein product [Parascedosporium putredinis]
MLTTNFRPSRLAITISATVFVVIFLGVFNYMAETPFVDISIRRPGASRQPDTHALPVNASSRTAALSVAAAGNATLGFSKILMINMEQRWDKLDAATIQAYVSGLQIDMFKAVDGKREITDMGSVGMPPASGGNLSGGQRPAIAPTQTYIWTDMIMNRSPPILILEADASWDANLRSIMSLANENFIQYLGEIKSKPQSSPVYQAQGIVPSEERPIQWDPRDPWLSEHWDIISVGHCNDQPSWYGEFPDRAYKDKWASTPGDLFTIPAGSSRWSYAPNIGMDKGADSDILQVDKGSEEGAERDMSGWDAVHKRKSAWVVSPKFAGMKFKQWALDISYSRIFS